MKLFREIPADGGGRPRWQALVKKVIGRDQPDGPFMVRYILLQTPWFGVYVHNLLRPDADRDCHDHPWVFGSLVLRGGYLEEARLAPGALESVSRRWLPGSWHWMPLAHSHRIVHVEPNTWSVVLVGPKVKDWGFWVFGGSKGAGPYQRTTMYWVQWRSYGALTPDPMDS